MTSEFFCEEIMEFINGTTGIQPPTNCSILSSTPLLLFRLLPPLVFPSSTAATLSSTSILLPPSHLQIVPLLLLPSLLFPPQLTVLCHLLLVLLPSSRLTNSSTLSSTPFATLPVSTVAILSSTSSSSTAS